MQLQSEILARSHSSPELKVRQVVSMQVEGVEKLGVPSVIDLAPGILPSKIKEVGSEIPVVRSTFQEAEQHRLAPR